MRYSFLLLIFLVNPMPKVYGDQTKVPSDLRFLATDILGTGCENSTNTVLSRDGQAITFSFSDFIAAVDPEGFSNKEVKTCTVEFSIESDSNWRFGILGLELRGMAFMEEGSEAQLEVGYRKDEESNTFFSQNYKGPYNETIINTAKVDDEKIEWYGCDGNNNFALDFSIQARTDGWGESYIAIDSIDGEMEQSLGVVWQRCDDPQEMLYASCRIPVVRTLPGVLPLAKEILVIGQDVEKEKLIADLESQYRKSCSSRQFRNQSIRCVKFDANRFCQFDAE